ncbi:MAG: extracellular solute-binding protein [Caldilineaceae bacterium]|nr:extracellular solute-binding protein [Caldilineaceae bacterium]
MAIKKTLTRRGFLQTSAVVAAGGVLAACAAPTAPAGQAGSAAAPTGELIELGYMTPDRELGNKVKAIEIERFNAKMEQSGQPYRVKDVRGPATDNDLRTKLVLDAAAGTLPDIFSSYASQIADFVAAGYVLDQAPYLEAWPDWEQYYEVLRELAYYDGSLQGLPGGSTFTWFVRKDVLEGAGISTEQPKTWEEFFAVCDQIAQKTDATPCGLPAATPWGAGTFYEGFRLVWLGFDRNIYDTAESKWVVSSPGLLKAFQVYDTLAKNGWLTVDALLSPNPWEPIKYQGFPEGTCVMVTGGDWQWTFDWGPEGATPIEGLFDKVDRWQFPSEDGNPFTYVEGNAGPQVAANTKSPEGAMEFIKSIGSPEVGCETMEIYIGGPAARKDFAEKCPAYKDIVGGKYEQASEFFNTGLTYKVEYVGTDKFAEGIARATEDIITGQATPEAAMAAFAEAMTDSLGAEMVKIIS